MQYEEIRRQVLGAIREAQARGLIHGTSGNIAVRQPGGGVGAITPRGRPHGPLQPEGIPPAPPAGGGGAPAVTEKPQRGIAGRVWPYPVDQQRLIDAVMELEAYNRQRAEA